MATAFVRHCCEKKLKIYFIALWPVGPQMIDDSINKVIKTDFPEMVYGEDYVNLGFKPGNEGVIKVIVTDLKQLYSTDDRGTNLDQIPMCRDLVNIQSMDLVAEVSAGYPGVRNGSNTRRLHIPTRSVSSLVARVSALRCCTPTSPNNSRACWERSRAQPNTRS